MLEKRPWWKLLVIFLCFIACTLVWHELVSYPAGTVHTAPTAYTLFTQDDTGYADRTLQLPQNDYNQLIDLNFNFIMINFICNETIPLLLILVHSSPKNFDKRNTIRETWGRKDDKVKVVFLMGSVNSTELQKRLEIENSLHKDFAQGNFSDSYRNLTYKHVMSLKYFVYHCPQAKYVLKTDDDVFVNMPTMKNFLRYDLSPHGASKGLFCTPRYKSLVLRSYRSKWRVSFTEYPDRVYPTYCPGWTILYTPDVVFGLYKEAQKTEYFWVDDIHLTGTLARRLNLTHTDIESLILSKYIMNKIVNYSYNYTQPFIYGREDLIEKEIRGLWSYVNTRQAPKFIFTDVTTQKN